jgi:hypothetical protein
MVLMELRVGNDRTTGVALPLCLPAGRRTPFDPERWRARREPYHRYPTIVVNEIDKTKSIFSVVREDDVVFAHKTPSYDGKDALN